MNTFAVTPSAQTPENDLIGKTTAGYQAWFHASADLDSGWGHWSHHTAPETGNAHTEMFPDLSEYPDRATFPCRFSGYPDGRAVRFYQGHDPDVIDIHFHWMQQYGIDGVGVQRFYGATCETAQPEPTHLTAICRAAERYGRIFYIMYDTSGCGRDGTKAIDRFKADVLHNVEGKGLISSPCYAHAGGKPVICVWGLAPTEPGRYPSAGDAVEFIRWLKERGYYVIGGLPDNGWAEDKSDYAAVYAMLDMISPWTPGRFRPETLQSWIGRHLPKDLAYCRERHIHYQPVLFAGFAWSNFGGGGNPNACPRNAGQFLWDQALLYARAGVDAAYFAMFDEYDEGTALAKAASDSFDLPVGQQYFQTLSADGYWLSSDYYLREAGAVTALLRGELSPTEVPPIPHATGPVFWRNGFERRPACLTVARGQTKAEQLRPVDVCDAHAGILEQEAVQLETAAVVCGRRGDVCYTGSGAFGFSGIAMTGGRCFVHYRLAKTCIPVSGGMTLSYMLRPLNEAGQRVGVDLLFDDGSRLSDYDPAVLSAKEAPRRHGVHPHSFSSEWRRVTLRIGQALQGKTVCAVTVAYDAEGEARFAAYLDDIRLEATAE